MTQTVRFALVLAFGLALPLLAADTMTVSTTTVSSTTVSGSSAPVNQNGSPSHYR